MGQRFRLVVALIRATVPAVARILRPRSMGLAFPGGAFPVGVRCIVVNFFR